MDSTRCLSVVVPVYSEETIIPEFYRRTKSVLAGLADRFDHEILFVDDGSRDGSAAVLKELSGRDDRVKVLFLSRNFGHQFAITAGLDHTRGDIVVTIDGDLQDPPEVIPDMIKKWEEGVKVVYGIRKKRQGENAFKLLTAKLFYRLIRRLSDTKMPLDAGDFRLMDRRVVEALRTLKEENRYLRGLVSWAGFTQSGILYQRDRRYAGKTKFSLKKMIRFALDGILSFSDKPLKLAAYFGFFITLGAFGMALRVLIGKLRHPEVLVSGWTSLILAVLFIGGIQLISLGILGLYLGRQYREVKRRPLYIVAEKAGFDTAPADGPDSPAPLSSPEPCAIVFTEVNKP
ncbi:MAG: glycosyltransferase family 2 protein [Candidatus Aminicenantes bacterium]|nr:glycosyltransferase family 2 protein [Candidatus Aminicenantes bacterium]